MRLKTLVRTLLTAIVGMSVSAAAQPSPTRTAPPMVQGNAIYSKLPLTFEANQGQTSSQVNFLSRGKGYTTFLTTGGMVLSLRPLPVATQPSGSSQPTSTTLQFQLLGASRNPQAVGEDLQPGIVNYFIGNDPAQWHTGVPTYAKVRYKNVYPGIDLIYYGSHQQLEYDFAVAPGADPRLIQFQVQGASEIQIDAEGNLTLATSAGELHFQSPIVYQESHGQRIPVEGSYSMQDPTHIGFQIAHYDSSKPLVIDPVLVYSTYLGGSGTDWLTGIAVDTSGSVYVAGYTDSPNFPLATLGALPTNTNHVFVAKLDPTGSNLVYADYVGGNSGDYGLALVLDSANEVYVTGNTQSNNFPVVKAYQSQQPGPYSGFLTKVSAAGSSLLYSTYLGGNTFDVPTSIAIDSLGEVHLAGYTMSQNFPVANAFQATASANQAGMFGTYGFLTKFSPDGSSLIYSTYLAGNSNVVQNCGIPCWPPPYNAISAVAVDTNGSAYVTGTTNTYNFPVTSGSYLTTNTTPQDAGVSFVSKFSSTGGLDYSTYFYASSGIPVSTSAIAVDSSGSAYVTGAAESDGTFPVTSTSICDPRTYGYGCSYAFVTKFDPAASTLLYSTFLGPSNYASPMAIALDANNDAYVVAATESAAFGTTNGVESYSNGLDVLLVEIDSAASTELLATYLGGSGNDEPAGIALDTQGNLYIAGSTSSTDFPTTQGAFQSMLGGSTNTFIAKIGATPAPSVSLAPNSLQFASIPVGSTSQAQTVLLRNMGNSPLTISSITASGDFAETDNCGTSVSAAGNCTFSVTFTPSAAGTRSGSILIQDDAAGSPHVINLTGTGSGAVATLSPASLTFSAQPVGTSSAAQTVTLTNTGNATLTVATIQITGDFAQVNNCPSTLAANANCTINVTFTPTAPGTRSGSLTISDNAQGSPQIVSLTGTGSTSAAPIAALTPSSLAFSAQPVGISSAAQAVTLTNTGNATLNLGTVQVTGDFAQINNCPATLAANSSCTFNITFAPTASGTRNGVLTVSDNAQGSPQTVSLSGTGADFNLTTSSSQKTVTAGATATYTLSVSPVGGSFSNAVSLSCSGLPTNATCKFSPSPVTPGANGASSTLTITTAASSADASPALPSRHGPALAAWMQLQGLGLFGMVLAGSKKRSKRLPVFILLALLVLGMMFMSGCAGGTGIAPQSGSGSGTTYTIRVTGSSGTLQHALPLTLTVQ
jgi:hypothetical protein